jgi:hypothetical protein
MHPSTPTALCLPGDAQELLARQLGFESWHTLKAGTQPALMLVDKAAAPMRYGTTFK